MLVQFRTVLHDFLRLQNKNTFTGCLLKSWIGKRIELLDCVGLPNVYNDQKRFPAFAYLFNTLYTITFSSLND